MSHLYSVTIEGIGDVLLERDTIDEARQWARGGFPGRAVSVSVMGRYVLCEKCDSKPCCCAARAALGHAVEVLEALADRECSGHEGDEESGEHYEDCMRCRVDAAIDHAEEAALKCQEGASEISLRAAATRNVAPEQNQALGDTTPCPGKSNGSEGKSESLPGKSVEIDSLKRDNISLAADYEGAWNRAQNNARLLYAILRWIDCHPDDPVPPQALLLDAREAVRHAGVMLAWGEGGEEAQGIPEKAANPPIDSPRGVAGDRCEVGNECGRVGCPECQQ